MMIQLGAVKMIRVEVITVSRVDAGTVNRVEAMTVTVAKTVDSVSDDDHANLQLIYKYYNFHS